MNGLHRFVNLFMFHRLFIVVLDQISIQTVCRKFWLASRIAMYVTLSHVDSSKIHALEFILSKTICTPIFRNH